MFAVVCTLCERHVRTVIERGETRSDAERLTYAQEMDLPRRPGLCTPCLLRETIDLRQQACGSSPAEADRIARREAARARGLDAGAVDLASDPCEHQTPYGTLCIDCEAQNHLREGRRA